MGQIYERSLRSEGLSEKSTILNDGSCVEVKLVGSGCWK